MKIKKILGLFGALFALSSFAFADEAKYKELLAKAKSYESKKQYVYALGAYWDAMEAEPTDKAAEAFNAFFRIGETLKNGQPGYATSNDFDTYDGWVAVCKDYEKYWTEYCPNEFIFVLKKGKRDLATRTGSYTLNIKRKFLYKFNFISDFVITGLESKRTDEWTEIPKDWPIISVYKYKADGNHYINNTALVREYMYDTYDYKYPEMLLAALGMGGNSNMPSIRMNIFESHLYEMKCNIVDAEGNVILKTPGVKESYYNDKAFDIDDIPQKLLEVYDSGKLRVEPTDLWLVYGEMCRNEYDGEKFWSDGKRFSLPIDLKKAKFSMNERSDVDVTAVIKKILNAPAEREAAIKAAEEEKARKQAEAAQKESEELFKTKIKDGKLVHCAFENNRGITNIIIPKGVIEIDFAAFSGCKALASVTIPDGVKIIEQSAFKGCKSLTSVTIPDSVTKIGDSVFWDCESLKTVTIPASVKDIGEDVFWGCESLKEISFTGTKLQWLGLCSGIRGRVIHCSDGDVDESTYKSLSEIIIPDGITKIGKNAFSGCESLKNITIPKSVNKICRSAFDGCKSLFSIRIPSSVKAINAFAFDGCDNLQTVNYTGSKSDWKNIDIYKDNKSNRPLLKAKINYSK